MHCANSLNTPESRNGYADLPRALALVLVVRRRCPISLVRYDAHHRQTGHSALK